MALEDVTKSLRLEPKMDMLSTRGANVYRELKRYDEAMADIEKAIKMKPARPILLSHPREDLRGTGYDGKGKADYKRACDNGEKEACEALKKLTGGK